MTDDQPAPEPAGLDATKLRRANVGNIVKKLKAGKTLSATEVKAIEAFEAASQAAPEIVEMGWLTKTLGLTKQRIAQLADEGTLVRHSHGFYKLQESVKNYIDRIRGIDADGIDWGLQIKKLEVEKREIELAEMRSETIKITDAISAAQRATAIWTLALRAKLETESPARLVGKDIAELRAEIRAVTDELCAEVVKALELEAAKP